MYQKFRNMKIQYIVLIVIGSISFFFSFRHFVKSCFSADELLEEPEDGFVDKAEFIISGYKFRKMVLEDNNTILTHEEIDRLARNIDNNELFEIITNEIISWNLII